MLICVSFVILCQMNEDDKVFKYIATDLYDYTLSEWLNTNEAKRLSDEAWMETAAVLIKDLLQALEYLHTREEPILHRDLKVDVEHARNVLDYMNISIILGKRFVQLCMGCIYINFVLVCIDYI